MTNFLLWMYHRRCSLGLSLVCFWCLLPAISWCLSLMGKYCLCLVSKLNKLNANTGMLTLFEHVSMLALTFRLLRLKYDSYQVYYFSLVNGL